MFVIDISRSHWPLIQYTQLGDRKVKNNNNSNKMKEIIMTYLCCIQVKIFSMIIETYFKRLYNFRFFSFKC